MSACVLRLVCVFSQAERFAHLNPGPHLLVVRCTRLAHTWPILISLQLQPGHYPVLKPVLSDAAWAPLRTHETACAAGATHLPAAAATAAAADAPGFALLTTGDRREPIPLPHMQLALVSAYEPEKLWVHKGAGERAELVWEEETAPGLWEPCTDTHVGVGVPRWPNNGVCMIDLADVKVPARAGVYRLRVACNGECVRTSAMHHIRPASYACT